MTATGRPSGIRRRPAGVLLAGVLVVGSAVVAGCSSDEPVPERTAGARPVTTEESELLALVRFRNFDAGSRTVMATYTDSGHDVGLDGWFDYASHTGYAVVATDGAPADTVVWDGATVAIAPEKPPSTQPVAAPRDVSGWTVAPLDPEQSRLGALLALLSRLGSDRPENPLLLRQGGALWLRTDEVGGMPVTVFAGPTQAGPSSGAPSAATPASEGATGAPAAPDPDAAGLRYWIDDTGLAHRVEARLGDTWATVDLGDGEGRTLPPLPAGAGAAASEGAASS